MRLHSVPLGEQASCIGKCVRELGLDDTGAEISAIHSSLISGTVCPALPWKLLSISHWRTNSFDSWRWASPHAGPTMTTVAVRDDAEAVATRLTVTRALRDEMAEMAQAMGRSEDEIWAEAAREWLMRRMRNDEPPPTTPAAAPLPSPRTRRLWNEIDIMLAELRHPRYITAPAEPTMPAA